jgi:putative mRNA 3-end processing factor
MLRVTGNGLYCEAGDFYVDPWCPVDRAVITHAHSDHAHWGCKAYLCSDECRGVLRARMGPDAPIETAAWGAPVLFDGVQVSFHPAGHILGSAQVRIELNGDVWGVSGDYKLEHDGTCRPFEPVRCNTFITESTFGLPIYRWRPQPEIFADLNAWWRGNQENGKASVLFAYALGKAQRLLAGVDPLIGPIFCHGAVEKLNRVYRDSGIDLPPTAYAGAVEKGYDWSRALIVAPPSGNASPYLRRFGTVSTGFASGWMRIRGTRRRRSIDHGFVLSDHADWPGLLSAIDATGAQSVMVTHGYRAPLVRWLCERGLDAKALETRFEGERDESGDIEPAAGEATADSPEAFE